MPYVLIFIGFFGISHPNTTSFAVEFSSMRTCDAAKEILIDRMKNNGYSSIVACVVK